MKKRIISILCALALCLGLLPTVALADNPTTLTVGGTNVLDGGCWKTNESGILTTEGASESDYNVKYDSATGTLTLKDATINGTNTTGHVGAGIYAEGDLTIVLEGSSTVTGVQDPNGESQSIRVSGNLTIRGGGSLTAQGADTSDGSSYGIFVTGSFTQQSGSVTASGGNVSGNYNSTGLYVYGSTVTVQGGTLTATGGTTGSGSYGISANGSVTVSDATVTATGGSAGYASYGLYIGSSSPSVTLSGSSSLTARSGTATNKAGGIYFQNPFGSAESVTVGENSTLLTNSVILYDNSFEAKPLTPTGDGSWLIYGQSDQPSAVGGTYTLTDDLTIENGNTFTIPAGSTLNLGGHTLTNDGTLNIANQSSLAGTGTLDGSGAFNLTNPDPVISGSETLTYDGTDHFNDFSLTAPIGTVEVMGQNFNISNTPSLEGWSLNQQEIKDAGTYTLTASNGTTTIEKEITVSPAEISITGATLTPKTYDGNTTATVESVTFDNLVNGESLSFGIDYTATAVFNSANAGSQSATVTVTLKGGSNYTFAGNQDEATYDSATGTISPLPVVLEWETTSFTYDGSEHSVTAQVTNKVGNDAFELTYENNAKTDVGNYTAKVTGLGNDNYTLTGATGVELTWSIVGASIADAQVTLSPESFTYTGQIQTPTVTVKLGDKTLNADDYDVTYSGESINAGTYTVTVTGKGNYSGEAASKTYTIEKATVTPSIISSTTKTYDGTTAATGLTITLEGVLSGDTVTATADSYAYNSANVAEANTVTANDITLDGADAGNYTLSSDTATANGTITPAALTVTADAKSKAYGDADPALTYTATGLVGKDKLTGELSRAEGENVGDYAITQGTLSAGSNYSIHFTSANLTITARPVTLSWSTPTSFTYDGSEHSVTAQVTNKVGNDAFELTYENNAKTDVGSYTAKVTGLGNTNYTLTGATGVELTWSIGGASIAGATVTLDKNSFTYDGSEQKPTVTVKLGGKTLNAETDYDVDFGGDSINAGTYTVTVTGKGNYSGEATEKPTYTIEKATVTPSIISSTTKTYDGTTAATGLTITLEGVLSGDTVTATADSYAYNSANVAEANTVTANDITLDGADAGNYTLSSDTATANGTITPAALTVTADAKSKAYGDADPALTYTATGLVGKDKLTGELSRAEGENVGDYAITQGTLSAGSNYSIHFTSANLTITARPVTLSWSTPTSFTYDGSEHSVTAQVTNKVGNDAFELTYENNAKTDVGSYTAKVTGLGNTNYTLTGATGVELTWSIGGASIAGATVTLSPESFTYDGNSHTPTVTVKLGGKTLTESDYTVTYSGDTTNVGEVTVTVTGKGNYFGTATEKPTYTINKADQAALSITSSGPATFGQNYTLTTSGGSGNGSVTFTVTDGTGAATVSGHTLTPTKAGTVTVTAVKAGDNNYNDGTSVSVTITINKGTYNGTKTASGSVLANWPGEVTLPAIPDGASYGTPSSSDVTDMSITGNVLSYTGGSGIVKGQTYTVTVPVTGATNYVDYNITVTLTGTDKTKLEITGVTAQNGTYSGQTQSGYTGTPSAEGYDGDFTVTYSTTDGKAPTNAGTYTVTLAIPDSIPQYAGSVVLEFTIAQKPLTVSAADVSVYTGSAAPELTLVYEGLVTGESVTPTEAPTFTITKADGTEIALANAVKTAGTYTITWSNAAQGFTDAANYAITVETGTLRVSNRPVTTNPGNTETVTKPDGTTVTTETKPDGTVTTTTTDKTGNKTQVVEKPDGSSQTTVTNKDGSSSTTQVDKTGQVEAEVKLPAQVVEAAAEAGEAVTLPMPELPVTSDRETAPTVTVDLPSNAAAQVEIPVKDVTPGTVAVLVKPDGTEEVIKTSVTTETGVAVTLSDGDTVKIVDNSKDFADVSEDYWGADAVAFATSRELFTGTSAATFSPDAATTRAMIVTVLARLEDVDTTDGSTWYEAGQQWAMENGISDGTNMEGYLTREQLAAMLYRYAGSPAVSGSLSAYPDAAQVSDWARDAMLWATENGIINGIGGKLCPKDGATRAQLAAMLMRFAAGLA